MAKMAEMRVVRFDDISLGNRFRQDFSGIEELAESIKAIGLLQPIGVTEDNKLVFGHRRLKAMQLLGWTECPVKTVRHGVLRAEHDENVCRQDFTVSEKVAIAEAIRHEVETAAKQRQIQLGRQSERVDLDPSAKKSEGSEAAGETRELVAASVGLSHTTLKKAVAVVEAAKADPIKHGPTRERMDATGNVGEAYRAITDQPEAEPVKLKKLTPLEQVLALIPKLSLQQNWAVVDALSMHRDGIKRGEAA